MRLPHFIRWWSYRWSRRRRARRQAEMDTRRRHPAYQDRIESTDQRAARLVGIDPAIPGYTSVVVLPSGGPGSRPDLIIWDDLSGEGPTPEQLEEFSDLIGSRGHWEGYTNVSGGITAGWVNNDPDIPGFMQKDVIR